ncbi:MAG: 5'-methylthioadenosine/S-adenosylhomocysteine nucleosidase [Anaerolineae bacterium]
MLAVALLLGCRVATSVEPEHLDATPRIALISAFSPELMALRDAAEISDRFFVAGRLHYVGTLEGNDVVMVLSGQSMINAAMTAQAVIDHFDVRALIVSGIAGGVNPNLNIGDVAVPARWGQYQEQVAARETDSGWDPGTHGAPYGNFGMMFPQKLTTVKGGDTPSPSAPIFWFDVDSDLLAQARRAADEVTLASCGANRRCLSHAPALIVGGNGVSGQTFVDNAAYRTWIWETFAADAVDMESAAVAHVAYVNDVPFIAFRSLSDLAGGGPGENEARTFMDLAADNSAAAVRAFLRQLSTTQEGSTGK